MQHITVEKLHSLRLYGMANALEEQLASANIEKLAFEERFALLLDREALDRDNRSLQRRLKNAVLRYPEACIEDIQYKPQRKLDRSQINALAACNWISERRNILVTGKTGAGKSFLACALAQKACFSGFSAMYFRTSKLVSALELAKQDGSYPRVTNKINRADLIVLDDFGLAPLTKSQQHHLFDILEERCERKSTIVASQFPVAKWYEIFDEPTLADAILDRIVHNAYRIDVKGDSMRKTKNSPAGK